MPYHIEIRGSSIGLVAETADAKGGGNGNGGGNGGGNGNGGGGNSGNGGGNGGSNGNGNGNSNGNGKNSSGKSAKQSQDNTDAATSSDDASMKVEHTDGMSEAIQNGRYVMKDSKGRTIINRSATTDDQKRLKSFVH
ncbi:hypothetical protein HB780_07245 (plasmid) [Rhizobium lusitanum]|nr:hypothetical protein HB780_07245 [Rhizobium lusitanum]